ncbi:MAG: cell wall-binding protein [Pseudomonadota bacterium]|nr:cell wall-binding protein [Pseudomonadota bacterium]
MSGDAGDLRASYEAAVHALGAEAQRLRGAGQSPEAIARHLHGARRALAARFKARTPEPMRSLIEARTLRAHGDVGGPSIETLRARGCSWEDIADSACRPGRLIFDPERGPVPVQGDGDRG